jgi:hypothetical protein
LTTQEVVDFLRSVLFRVQRSRAVNDFIEAKNICLGEVVAVAAVVKAVADLLQTLAELISTPSLELRPLRSANDTKRRALLQVPQGGTPCLPMPGSEGQRAGRHAQQAEMMVAWLLFARF